MPTLFDAPAEQEVRDRIRRLDPATPARWGKFTAPAMVCHLIDAFRISLGEHPTKSKGTNLSFPPLRWLILNVLPMPKGVPTAPEYLTTKPDEWDRDVARLEDYVTRFLANGRNPAPVWAPHPAFGQMNTHQWGVLAYKHIAHHLTQFGV